MLPIRKKMNKKKSLRFNVNSRIRIRYLCNNEPKLLQSRPLLLYIILYNNIFMLTKWLHPNLVSSHFNQWLPFCLLRLQDKKVQFHFKFPSNSIFKQYDRCGYILKPLRLELFEIYNIMVFGSYLRYFNNKKYNLLIIN